MIFDPRKVAQEISGQQLSEQRYLQRLEEEEFGDSTLSKVDSQPFQILQTKLLSFLKRNVTTYKIFKVRKYLWNLTEYPETSLAARVREMYNKTVSEDFPRTSFPKTRFPDLCVHLDDCGDYLDAHLRPLHDAGVGRGYRRCPLRQRDRCVGGFS